MEFPYQRDDSLKALSKNKNTDLSFLYASMCIPSTERKTVFYFTVCPAQLSVSTRTRERNAYISCSLLVLWISSKKVYV